LFRRSRKMAPHGLPTHGAPRAPLCPSGRPANLICCTHALCDERGIEKCPVYGSRRQLLRWRRFIVEPRRRRAELSHSASQSWCRRRREAPPTSPRGCCPKVSPRRSACRSWRWRIRAAQRWQSRQHARSRAAPDGYTLLRLFGVPGHQSGPLCNSPGIRLKSYAPVALAIVAPHVVLTAERCRHALAEFVVCQTGRQDQLCLPPASARSRASGPSSSAS
jgi:hypothetical protein